MENQDMDACQKYLSFNTLCEGIASKQYITYWDYKKSVNEHNIYCIYHINQTHHCSLHSIDNWYKNRCVYKSLMLTLFIVKNVCPIAGISLFYTTWSPFWKRSTRKSCSSRRSCRMCRKLPKSSRYSCRVAGVLFFRRLSNLQPFWVYLC